MTLHFVETAAFSKRIARLGLEAQLRELQVELLRNPKGGALDPGTGGLRKLRIGDAGRSQGKRGGARVHYLYLEHHAVIYLVFVYAKDEQATLSPNQKKALTAVVDAIKSEWDRRR